MQTLQTVSKHLSIKIFLPAEMWRDYVRNINVVDATQEGRPNDHQYKHEPIFREDRKGYTQLLSQCDVDAQKSSSADRSCTYLIMSSIIFPMEIWSVPKDSWAGRMYARRVKLSMLVTANSTSAIS